MVRSYHVHLWMVLHILERVVLPMLAGVNLRFSYHDDHDHDHDDHNDFEYDIGCADHNPKRVYHYSYYYHYIPHHYYWDSYKQFHAHPDFGAWRLGVAEG